MASSSSSQSQGARYFGETSPQDLKELERNALGAKRSHMATAASYLEEAFEGQYYAWFGGWALNLRGSRRETRDIDLLVLANDVGKVRATLASYPWAILSFYEIIGSIQERMFVDIGENGQVVGVDIVLSGRLDTPVLGDEGSYELIQPSFTTPQGSEVPVIHLTWQVEGKLGAWISRKKMSDFDDLVFLFQKYGDEIIQWSEHLDMQRRLDFYGLYEVVVEDNRLLERMKKVLRLDD